MVFSVYCSTTETCTVIIPVHSSEKNSRSQLVVWTFFLFTYEKRRSWSLIKELTWVRLTIYNNKLCLFWLFRAFVHYLIARFFLCLFFFALRLLSIVVFLTVISFLFLCLPLFRVRVCETSVRHQQLSATRTLFFWVSLLWRATSSQTFWERENRRNQ